MEKTTKKSETLRGPATIRKLRDSLQVRMGQDDPKGKYKKGQMFEVALADAPKKVYDGEGFWVNMNKTGTQLYSQSPLRGNFHARFVSWAGKPGAIPTPRFDPGGRQMTTRDGRQFTTQPSVSMDAVYEIVGGKFDGLTAVAMLPYIFVEDSKGCVGIEGGPKQIERVEQWMEVHGIEKSVERLAYAENLLPKIGSLLRDQDKVVDVEIENGLVVRLTEPADDYRPAKRNTAAKKGSRK